MHYMPEFITVLIIHILGVMLPGPDLALVTRSGLLYSRRSAVLTALGIALGNVTHVSYALLGIAYVVEHSIALYGTIKLLGAGYLMYIGYRALRSKKPMAPGVATAGAPATLNAAPDMGALTALRTGFICNALNPKCALFFLSIFTQVISPTTPRSVQALYGTMMVVTAFMWFGTVAVVFSHERIKTRFAPVQHRLEKFFGAILIALGIKVAVTR